jgi:hypothetical protein
MRCPGLGLAGFLEQKTQGKFWRGPGRQVCQAIEIDDTQKKNFFVCVWWFVDLKNAKKGENFISN